MHSQDGIQVFLAGHKPDLLGHLTGPFREVLKDISFLYTFFTKKRLFLLHVKLLELNSLSALNEDGNEVDIKLG